MHCPVAAAQSTSGRRSLNSPMPKSDSVRRENTGIAVPAPLKPGRSNFGAWCSRGKGQPGIGQSIHLSSISLAILELWCFHSVRQMRPSRITT